MSLTDRMHRYVLSRSSSLQQPGTLDRQRGTSLIPYPYSRPDMEVCDCGNQSESQIDLQARHQPSFPVTYSTQATWVVKKTTKPANMPLFREFEPNLGGLPAQLEARSEQKQKIREKLATKISFDRKNSIVGVGKLPVRAKLPEQSSLGKPNLHFAEKIDLFRRSPSEPFKIVPIPKKCLLLTSPANFRAESPKVAPHPGDKDIPLITNHVGLLESATFDFSSKDQLRKASTILACSQNSDAKKFGNHRKKSAILLERNRKPSEGKPPPCVVAAKIALKLSLTNLSFNFKRR